MRYQLFNSRDRDAPCCSVPWEWLAYSIGAVMSNWCEWVDLVDSKTGVNLLGWSTSSRPLVLFGEKRKTISHIQINSDGTTHELVLGSVLVGPSQTTIEGDGLVRDVNDAPSLPRQKEPQKAKSAGYAVDFRSCPKCGGRRIAPTRQGMSTMPYKCTNCGEMSGVMNSLKFR